jgi:hypothetical protein
VKRTVLRIVAFAVLFAVVLRLPLVVMNGSNSRTALARLFVSPDTN